ncbi:hypothetical protein HKD37_18G050926 [Glycine soja]
MGGIACAQQGGDLDTCCLVFLSVSVAWARSGYFLMNGTTLHLRVEENYKQLGLNPELGLDLKRADNFSLSNLIFVSFGAENIYNNTKITIQNFVLLCSNLESMSNLKLMLQTFIIDPLNNKTNNNRIIMIFQATDTIQANDHPEYAILARDKILHSESDKSDGADGYSVEPSSTMQNPKNVSAITLRSGNQIQVPPPVETPAPEPVKLHSTPEKEDEIVAQRRKLPNKNFHAESECTNHVAGSKYTSDLLYEVQVEEPSSSPTLQSGPLGPSRFFLQKVVASGGSNLARLGELGKMMGTNQNGKRQAFRKVYGKILDLTAAEVFTKAVVSLAQYYDQSSRCFTFGDFQMVPTIEEFEEILGCPLGGRKPYLFFGFLPSLSKIAAVVGDSEKELDRMKQTRNDVVGLPRKYLEGKARDMASQEKWGPFVDILALLIFGVVLFPNVDGLVDLAAIDAFLAYHHSKKSPVVAILADLFDTFDRRCEKNSARIVCCLPALCVWLVSHLFQQDTRHPCPLQSYRLCAEKERVDWDQHLAGIGGSASNWFPRWKEGKEGVLFSCGDYPNVPLIETRGCINYNPALAIRQLGDLGAQSPKVIQRIHKAWRSPLRKDKELRGIRNGVIGGYHGWLRIHTRGLDWLSKLKVIDEENFEAPEEDEEVRALKLELGKARLAKEKFKSAATHIRKECTELQEENAATARSLEQETKRDRKEEYGREKFRGALWGSNSELKLRREERDRSRVHGMILKEELAACARSNRSLAQHLEATEQSMLAIIGQYKEELNQSVAHEQKLVEDFAQVYAEKEARGRVIDALHQEETMWMDRFALTLNGSQDLPRLLAKAKAMAEVCTAPEEIHGLINYCQHMIDLMAHIIRNPNFADLVFAGERIESGLRKGKFEYAANMAPNNSRRAPVVGARKKEGDAHAVTTAPTWMKAPQNIQSSYQPNPPNFLIRAGNTLPTQVKGPPAAERAPAQCTALAAPRPVNNTAPGATYQYAQHPPPKDNFPPIPMAYSENGFEPGMGLGKGCLGNADVVDIKGNPYKYGLGYEPGMPGRRNVPSRFRADRVWPGRISQCFTSAGMVSQEEVVAIEEEFPQDPPSFVQPCHPDSQVGNWRVISQSEVYTADSMYIGTDASGDRVTTDRSLPLPGAKQAENVSARQPSELPERAELAWASNPCTQIIKTREGNAKYSLKAQVEKDEGPSGEGQSPRVEKDEGPSNPCGVYPDLSSLTGSGVYPDLSSFTGSGVYHDLSSFTGSGVIQIFVTCIKRSAPTQTYQGNPCGVYPDLSSLTGSGVYPDLSSFTGSGVYHDLSSFTGSGVIQIFVTCIKRSAPTQVHIMYVDMSNGIFSTHAREMAPRKLALKRSRKDKAAEGTSSAPEYDSHRFRSAEHQQRFEAIKGRSFLRERRVQLRNDEYTDFQEEIVRRQWASLVTPMAKFYPDILLEFYANAWPTKEGVRDIRSWVRGQWIPFDADAISQFLGYPLVLEEGQECEYGQRRNRSDGFDEEAIAHLLCIPGQNFARTAAGRRVRIMRTNMTTLTQIWMTLLLSNIQPSDHNSDLPLPKCQLVYAILTWMSIHVTQLIADAIYLFAGMAPTRHPLDPDKSNRALGFPALITGLCQSFGVPVAPNKVIRPPITRAFIEKDRPRGMLRRPQTRRHLIRLVQPDRLIRSSICGIWFASRRPTTELMYRPMISQGFTSFPCPTLDQFRAEVAWPRDWPEARAGEAPAEAPDEADEAREDEEMTDLLDFLGGSGAT